MVLVISEKPNVGVSLSAVLGAEQNQNGCIVGNGYIVSWCIGHLLGLAPPDAYGDYSKWRYEDLPIIPAEWKHTPVKGKSEQIKILCGLMNRPDVELIINACDAGREGELIFRLIYEHAGCRKPVKRLWISSMEDAAIRDGLANLKDGAEYDDLYAAALCRERADWEVGINSTRLFSTLYGVTLNTGRVQSPTLAMLVKREAEIESFVKTPFYTVELSAENLTATSDRFNDKAAAESVAADCRSAAVTSVTQTEKTVAPPKLYDLTTLQREANRAYGYTAQQTLDYVQSLYEKKLSTYPRTDSRYLTEDMAGSVTTLVSAFAPDAPCNSAQVINPAKVTDHHAVIPTHEAVNDDISGRRPSSALPSGEQKILDMLINRLICAVGEKHRYLETIVTLDGGGTEFKAKGKTIIHNGWKGVSKAVSDEENKDESAVLPELSDGQVFKNVTAAIKEGMTSPPKHFTEDTLLSAMETASDEDMQQDTERKGLGTPATRASIIEKLVKTGFVERSKKNLIPTAKGKNLIAVLPTVLTSAKLTAEWEHKLLQVERGELDGGSFMSGISEFTKSIVLENKEPKPEFAALFPKKSPPLGVCPRCGSPVREGGKGFFCDNRDCGFKLWKNSKFWTAKRKPLTAEIVAALLKDGRVMLTDLFSEKTGRIYDATVILDDSGDKHINFKMDFSAWRRVRK